MSLTIIDENKCKKCNKVFAYNYLLIRHQSRKTSCIPKSAQTELNVVGLDDKIREIDLTIRKRYEQSMNSKKFKCYLCMVNFTNKSNLSRHCVNYCTKKKQLENDKKNLILSKKNLQEKIYQNINIENNTNIVVNIINPFKINSFGQEDVGHIKREDYIKYMSTYFRGFLAFIENIHFNKNVPENHNVYISNINSKYAIVYENSQWKLKDRDEVIDKIKSDKFNFLDKKVEEMDKEKELDNKVKNRFEDFRNKLIELEEADANTQKDIRLMLYNNRHLTMKNRKRDLLLKNDDNPNQIIVQ
jgi:hypothetical protein